MKKIITSLVLGGILLMYTTFVRAEIQSPQYRIVSPEIGIDASGQTLQTTLSSDELATFEKVGYVIRNTSKNDLRATISHATITFDDPSKTQNISTDLTVNSDGTMKYQTLLQADHPLQTVWGTTIPDTNCDDGCTVNYAQPWNRPEVTGFGYTIKGDDITADFKDISYYRRLANKNEGRSPKNIMHGKIANSTRQATVIFRLNRPSNQPDGTYETVVNFIVTPVY